MKTRTIDIYEYDELSDKAKEVARDWYRSCIDDSDFAATIEDAVRVAAILGIEIATHEVTLMSGAKRQDPSIWYDLDIGGGANFEGFYRYAKGSQKAIRKETSEAELHRIADELFDAQSRAHYSIGSCIKADRCYMTFDTTPYERSEAVEELLIDFSRWIYRQILSENQYLNSDEQVEESIRANEYEFFENGKRA